MYLFDATKHLETSLFKKHSGYAPKHVTISAKGLLREIRNKCLCYVSVLLYLFTCT